MCVQFFWFAVNSRETVGASDVTCDVMFPFLLATVKPHSNQDGVCVHLCVCVCVCVCVGVCMGRVQTAPYAQSHSSPQSTFVLKSRCIGSCWLCEVTQS